MKRRHFLQATGSTIAALGISQLELHQHSLRYAKVLAQSTPRKRALLVGISDYKYASLNGKLGWNELPGAVNDVDLQHELLVHRFGFQAGDITILKNKDAGRQNILRAMEDLVQWSQPGDVVVIHYSGHGSTVDDPDRIFDDNLNGTIVPYDSDRPIGGGPVDDITSGTLFLLMAALKTENVTLVLDSCYAGGGTRGNLVMRSIGGEAERSQNNPSAAKIIASSDERVYQEGWLKKLQWSREDWIEKRKVGISQGVALAAARRNQQAADATFAGDAHAGVFSYALTRHLWQQTRNESMGTVLVAAQEKTKRLLSTMDGKIHHQVPEFQEKFNSGNQQKQTFFLSNFAPQQRQSAEAVVTAVEGNEVKMLLNGVEPQILETFSKGASLNVVNAQGRSIGTVEIRDRTQLRASGIVKLNQPGTIAPGALLQEKSRVIPQDWSLRIGLDESLGNEMAIAEVELPKIQSRIEAVPMLKQEVHYILGRMTPAIHKALSKGQAPYIPEINSLGLFYSGLEPLVDSFKQSGESVTQALSQRLVSKFKFLLAGRLLKLTLNPASTKLKVKAAVKISGMRDLVGQIVAVRGGQATPSIAKSVNQVRVGQQIQILVENDESRDLQCAIVFLSPNGEVEAFPRSLVVPAKGSMVVPGDTNITIRKPLGAAEVMVVVSTKSLDNAIAQLKILSDTRGDDRGSQSVSTDNTLLNDLSTTRSGSVSQDRYLDVQQIAVLSITLGIIDS
jgi:hypothetical protein